MIQTCGALHTVGDIMFDRNSLLVISQAFPPEKGGNASRMHDLTRFMTDEWDVTVVAPSKCYPHGEYDRTWERHQKTELDGITVHRIWAWQPVNPDPSFVSRILYYLTFALHAFVWTLFHRRDHDVILTTSPPLFTGFVAFPFAVLFDTPWVVDIRDLWIDVSVNFGFISKGGLIERASKAYRQRELNTADLVTVTTEETKTALRSQYDLRTPVEVIPNGVDVHSFDPGSKERSPVVIYTGTIGHCQDLESCVAAMEYVEDEAVTLKIVGDGDVRDKLEEMTAERGLEDRIEFTGFVDRERVPDLLASAAIGVAPIKPDESLRYAVPTKVYEYMSCELPVLAVGDGALKNIVETSRGGIVAGNDPVDVANKIDLLASDPALRDELGENGRRHMQRKYDREAISAELQRHLSRLVDGTTQRTVSVRR